MALIKIEAGDAGGACAVADQFGFLDVAAREVDRVDHAGGRDDRRSMLIVMKNRNIHQFAQALFDDETFRRLDVFEIDAAEGRSEVAHGVDEFFRVFGPDFEIDGIDIRETLEQDALALHDRLGRQGPEIAQAENGGAIGDDRDQIALDGVVIGFGGIVGDRMDRHGDAGRIGQRKIALGRHRFGGHDLEFSGPSARMELQRFLLREGRSLAAARLVIGHYDLCSSLTERRT